MKNNNSIIYMVIIIGSILNVFTIVAMLTIATEHAGDSMIQKIQSLVSDFRVIFFIAALISFCSVICGIMGIAKLADINEYDKLQHELKEEKEKYELATLAFMELQKTKRIN